MKRKPIFDDQVGSDERMEHSRNAPVVLRAERFLIGVFLAVAVLLLLGLMDEAGRAFFPVEESTNVQR